MRRRVRVCLLVWLLVAVTGAAPIPAEMLAWFRTIGVALSEIYGLSATRITHNVNNLGIATLIFMFRALIGLSLLWLLSLLCHFSPF